MKKFFVTMLIVFSAICGVSAFAACGKDTHTHEYGEWEVITAPTCTEEGTRKHVCSVCGYEEVQAAPALGHDCTYVSNNEGKHTGTCTRVGCDYTVTADCVYGENVVAPTCAEIGYTEHTCSLCSYSYRDNETETIAHNFKFRYNGLNSEGVHSHTMYCDNGCGTEFESACEEITLVTPAECERDGYTTHICTVCSNEYTDGQTLATGHRYGRFEHYITGSGEHGHAKFCTNDGCKHFVNEICEFNQVAKDATCTESGEIIYTCKTCSFEYSEETTPALTHDYGDWVFTGDHENPEGVHTHERTCRRDGCDEKEVGYCSYSTFTTDPTCTDDGYTEYKCAYCNHLHSKEVKEKLGHDYPTEWTPKEGVKKHYKQCRRPECGYIDEQDCVMVEASSVPPTCTEGEKVTMRCRDCSYAENADGDEIAEGHTWGKYTHEIEGPHEGQHRHYQECTKCHEKQFEECSFTATTTQSTCTADGFTTYTCSACSYNYVDDYTDKTEHKLDGDWIAEELSEENEFAYMHYRTCLVCGTKVQEACDFTQNVVQPTCTDQGYTEYKCNEPGCTHSFIGDYKDPIPHNWSSYRQDSKTNESGEHVHYRYCLTCYTNDVSEVCHKGNARTVEATCSSEGYTTYYCDVCKADYKADYVERKEHTWGQWRSMGGSPAMHFHICDVCKVLTTSACDIQQDIKDATCTTDGRIITYCTECNRRSENTIPALGHDYPAEYTYNGNGTHSRTCNRLNCNNMETDDCEMTTQSTPYTCESAEKIMESCKYCSNSTTTDGTPAPGHAWGEWKHGIKNGSPAHYHVCETCGKESDREVCSLSETVIAASCTTQEAARLYCETCSYENIVPTGKQAFGHNLQLIGDPTDSNCHVKCMRDDCLFEHDGAHEYIDSNLCAFCQHDGLIYQIDEGETHYTVLSDNNVLTATSIIIPATYGEKNLPVTEIASSWTQTGGSRNGFVGNVNIREVIIPETLTLIGKYAFENCINLQKVTMVNEESDEFSPSLKEIGEGAFFGCSSLQSAGNLPDSLKIIGSNAFSGCTSLTDIHVPDGVDYIGDRAFSNTAYVKDSGNWEGSVLYIGKHIIAYTGEDEEFEVKPEILSISAEAFKGRLSLQRLILHKGLRDINADAFAECYNLAEVTFHGKFADWMAINFANDNANPAHIADNFHITEAEQNIVIPDYVKAIPNGTFSGTTITSVEIPENVTYIGSNAFKDCTALATIKIHGKVEEIGEHAFDNTAYYNQPEHWQNGLLYLETTDGAASYLIASKQDEAGDTITTKENCILLADFVFAENSVIKTVTLNDGLVYIGDHAFYECSSLTTVKVGVGARAIGAYAFYNCRKITSFTFAESGRWLADNGRGAARAKDVKANVHSTSNPRTDYGKWSFIQTM